MDQMTTDDDLLRRTGRGDMLAYRHLLERHANRGLKVAERLLGNRHDAEDVLQEACLKVLKEASRWQPRAQFSTWFYRVVWNACLDLRRKTGRLVQDDGMALADEREPSADERLIRDEQGQRVRAALQKLPERQRLAIVLTYYEDLSNAEAATIMEVVLGAFQQLLFRAKANLRMALLADVTTEEVNDVAVRSTR